MYWLLDDGKTPITEDNAIKLSSYDKFVDRVKKYFDYD